MAICPMCNKKFYPWGYWFLRGITWCSCGAQLRLKNWIFWQFVPLTLALGSIFVIVWLSSAFNVSLKMLSLCWLLFIIGLYLMTVLFAKFIKY